MSARKDQRIISKPARDIVLSGKALNGVSSKVQLMALYSKSLLTQIILTWPKQKTLARTY